MRKKISFGMFLLSVIALGLVTAGCDAIGPTDTTTTTRAATTTTTAVTTTTTTTTANTTTTTTSTTLPFQVSGTILQGACTFEASWIGFIPWPGAGDYLATTEVAFISGEADYIIGTSMSGTFAVVAMSRTYENTTFIGAVGATTGELSAITIIPVTFEVGVPVSLIAPTFEMYVVM